MLKFLKILFFALILIVQFSSGLFFPVKGAKANDMKYEFQVPISTEKSATFDGSTAPIGLYIQGIYKYAIGVVAIIATVIMMFGGFLWIVAGGNAEQIGNAKAWIGASLSGLVLVMLSYTILSFINPDLVNFKKQTIKSITAIKEGCCQYKEENKIWTEEMPSNLCDKKQGKMNFFPGYISDQQGGGCVEPGVCCLVALEATFRKWWDCYEHMPVDECKLGRTLFGDNVVDVKADPDYKGACGVYKNPPTSCNVKPLR